MTATQPAILIIVGLTGDLGKRKLLPAIGQLSAAGVLPEQFRIVGITRRSDVDATQLIGKGKGSEYLKQHVEMYTMDLAKAADYEQLGKHLHAIERQLGGPAQRLFYLSVPPQVSQPIIEFLGSSGLARVADTKLLMEKPFGVDLASATELVEHIDQQFQPDQVYRIDHYLAKEMAQNMVVFRQNNPLFAQTWNHNFIKQIDIVASEAIGIEGRTTFYEQTGALRDLIQSHLLQLAALTLMNLPPVGELTDVPANRLAALRRLKLAGPPLEAVRRGQYDGYRQETGVDDSTVETFAAVTLSSSDPDWQDVPIRLITGKSLAEKATFIRLTYHQSTDTGPDELILRLQPKEGIQLSFWTKAPGYESKLEHQALTFAYDEHFKTLPEAYERVFLDAIRSDHSLFTTSEEVLETWRILEPVLHTWSIAQPDDLVRYRPGTAAEAV